MEDVGTVSVIIPVYGVEKYLQQCLESVCRQSYQNLEIIIIDDESPDLSGKIADDFAASDQRIKALHIKNRGAAGARNIGLEASTGDYIMFIDSDDWVEPDMVEKLLQILIREKCDIVQCQYMNETCIESVKQEYHAGERVCNDADYIKEMISKWEYVLIWNKIYRKSVIKDIRFVEGRCIDDEFYTYKVIMNARKIVLCNQYLYHYRLRKSGAMGNVQKVRQRFYDQADFITLRYPVLCSAYPELKKQLCMHMLEVLMSVMRNGAEYACVYRYAKARLMRYGIPALVSDIDMTTKKSILIYMVSSRTYFLNRKKIEKDVQQNYFE